MMMPVAGAASLQAWTEVSALPVSDSGQRLLGVLRHATLKQIERERGGEQRPEQFGGAMGFLAQAYWGVVCGLLEASADMLVAVDPVLPEDQ